MIAVVGYVGILTALGAAVWLMVQGVRVVRSPEPSTASLRAPVMLLLVGALVAFATLELAILTHDFSIEYVAQNTARATPFVFLLASGWAALEGSIVLWGIVLALFVWLVARTVSRRDVLGAGALAVMGAVAVFWFGLMATAANPFAICTEIIDGVCSASSWLPVGTAVAPTDGLGPNPLLQNHILMAVHPPMLYLGYVGFTVPFAFAVSALATGRQGRAWLDRTHRWSLIAWTFLTAGIFLGGWWSYEVLGWGGYWAWDPVENAALLPWLVGTAFIHSAVVQRRRGMLQAWNFVLIIATFALTILGTFLTRSGVVASVHSFTQSPVGPALLGFLAVTTIGALALFAFRAESVTSSKRLESLSSREGFFLLNNLLLTLFAFTVLVGTVYPLVVEAFDGREVSVGRPFFDRVSVPIAFALLLAIGVGAVAPWRVATPHLLWVRTRLGVMVGLLAGAGAVLAGVRSIAVVVVVALAGFLIGTIAGFFARQVTRRRGGHGSWGRAVVAEVAADPGYWGGQISHLGLALAAIAIATTSVLAVRAEVRLAVGDTARVGEYCVEYLGPFQRSEPSRFVRGADVAVFDAACSNMVATLQPRIHQYPNATQAVATPAVRTGLIDDVYVSLAGGTDDEIALDVFVFPLQWLLWLGGLVVVVGGLVALGRKARRPPVPTEPQETDAETAHV